MFPGNFSELLISCESHISTIIEKVELAHIYFLKSHSSFFPKDVYRYICAKGIQTSVVKDVKFVTAVFISHCSV